MGNTKVWCSRDEKEPSYRADHGAAKEVVLTQRGILDISITILMKTLHVSLLLDKEKGRGNPASETRPLHVKTTTHSLERISTTKKILKTARGILIKLCCIYLITRIALSLVMD